MPEISVVLPVFNSARTVGRAVKSILDQTLGAIEVVVVDDGSTDETVAIVRAFHDPRLRLIQRDHQGVTTTANHGTLQASAALIARMDADDVAHPRRLQLQLELLRKRDFDAVGCRVRILDEAGQRVASMQRYERWINEETLDEDKIAALRFVEFPLVNPTILARRKYFELGFRHGDFPEDYDLMLRAAAAGMRFGKVAEVLHDWSDFPGRLTRTDSRYTPEAFMRCRRSHLLAGPLRSARSVDLWGVGQTGKPWLRWLQEHDINVRRGYDIDKRKLNEEIHGVRITHPTDMPLADGTPLVIAVGADNARNMILPQIESRGYFAGKDAWFVA